MAIASDADAGRVKRVAPARQRLERGARPAASVADQNSSSAGFPASAASERVSPARSGTEKSGAGNGS